MLTTMIRASLQKFNLDRRAVTAIEYALIAALIAVVIIAAVTTLGKTRFLDLQQRRQRALSPRHRLT